MKNAIFFIMISSWLMSCGLQTEDYYFNLEDFKEAKVYKLVCAENPGYTTYLELQSDPETQTLTTITYGSDRLIKSRQVEKFTNDGAELVSFTGYYIAEGKEITDENTILENQVMLWSVSNAPFSYKIQSQNPMMDGGTAERQRSYVNNGHVDVMGEKYKVLIFKDAYHYNHDSAIYINHMYYAEGLGLVMVDFEREGVLFTLKLEEILSLEEWKQLLKE